MRKPDGVQKYRPVALDGVLAGLSGADPDHVVKRMDKDLSVPNLAGLGVLKDDVQRGLELVVWHDHLELDLGDKVHGVFRSAVHFRVPFLPAEAPDFGHRHALHSALTEGVFYVFQFEMANDGFNLLHGMQSLFKALPRGRAETLRPDS